MTKLTTDFEFVKEGERLPLFNQLPEPLCYLRGDIVLFHILPLYILYVEPVKPAVMKEIPLGFMSNVSIIFGNISLT